MNKLNILQINTWFGKIKDGLTDFIANGNYDVVCMQEAMWSEEGTDFLNLFIDSVDIIKDRGGFNHDFRSPNYAVGALNNEVRCEYGNVILSKIPFQKTEEKLIYGECGFASSLDNFKDAIVDHGYTAQKVTLENGLVILNYHGYWLKDPLGDDTSTQCMRSVADMIRDEKLPVVMCGDLNVTAEAKCMRELDFLTDLTATHNVKTTLRNIRFKKDVPCDHILISNNVSYDDFLVLNAPVSDHRALSVSVTF